jgi:hypothetical protein
MGFEPVNTYVNGSRPMSTDRGPWHPITETAGRSGVNRKTLLPDDTAREGFVVTRREHSVSTEASSETPA